MAADPSFFATPTVQGAAISATAYGGTRTSPTGTTTIYTGSSSVATQIRRIDVKSLGTTAAAVLEFWLFDGTTHYLLPYGTPIVAITGSTATDPWQVQLTIPEGAGSLVLPAAATAWQLRAAASITQTSAIMATVHGATA